MEVEVLTTLSQKEARRLTDEVKKDAQALWHRLVQLYDGNAHESLGYSAWHEYCEAEFGFTKSGSYQALDAGRVSLILRSENGVNQDQARELAPLLKKRGEEAVVEVWENVNANGSPPTAKKIREKVQKLLAPAKRQPKAKKESAGSAARVLPDYLDPEADTHGRTQLVEWYMQGRAVKQLLEDGGSIEPRSEEDRVALLNDANEMTHILQTIKRKLK